MNSILLLCNQTLFMSSRGILKPTRQNRYLQIKCWSLPLPIEVAIPFINWDRDLPGEPEISEDATELLLRRSIFPACCRNFSSSLDKRLNCSLCVRHFSSSSRTLAFTRQNTDIRLRSERATTLRFFLSTGKPGQANYLGQTGPRSHFSPPKFSPIFRTKLFSSPVILQ